MVKKFILKNLTRYASKWVVLAIDLLLVLLSFFLSYSIAYNASLDFDLLAVLRQVPVVFFLSVISFLTIGSYRGIVRHTGTKDAFNVFMAATLFCILMLVIASFNSLFEFSKPFVIPKSIIIIHYFVSTFVLILSRFLFKAFFEVLSTELEAIKTVLIYGAGDSGIITYGALNGETKNNIEVIGFIDDDLNKIDKKIDRIKIYSPKSINQAFIEKYEVDEVIISIQDIEANKLLAITDRLMDLEVEVKIVPPLSKWIGGALQFNQIRQVNIEDLLDREQISIDNPIVQREVRNKVVMVTGAAGSIGSEISRQLSLYDCQQLILLDQAESDLYNLQQELIQKGVSNFIAIVCDIRDQKRISKIFAKHIPDHVFHAAAYKHVPLMEESPYEALRINVCGTKNLADLAIKHKVERFVMISTDKAVNPTNVMGATKRIAELYIGAVSKQHPKTKFTITRFGNVLGSNGSVIPLFREQIKNGGPLTVTHKEMTRYFMTIPEACSLVLEAGTMGVGGEIYIFDMGESVEIFKIAKRMISLSGLKYPTDIDIQITGLRPGEKLYEELLAYGENTIKTYHEKIMIAKTHQDFNQKIGTTISALYKNVSSLTDMDLVKIMKNIVPEYKSNNSKFEKLDLTKEKSI